MKKNSSLSGKCRKHLNKYGFAGVNQNKGYCHCCRQNTFFQINHNWLRDHYICIRCHSIPRQRHLQFILDRYFEGWEQKIVHESSPSNAFIAQYCTNYSKSQFFPNIQPGEKIDGVQCENLEKLTFKDNSIDIFITQDVFEHIFEPSKAAQEIARVLKPGGAHIYTVPKQKNVNIGYPRAKMVNGTINYLLEPSYHGSPVGDGRALVTWDYGDDFEKLVFDWSNLFTSTFITKDRNLGIDGEFIEVFVTKK